MENSTEKAEKCERIKLNTRKVASSLRDGRKSWNCLPLASVLPA